MGTPDALLGREDELARLRSFLGEIAGGGSVLCLSGDPGIGKTALLDAAVQLAHDRAFRVGRAAGSPAESDLPYATLHHLLWPLTGRIGQLTSESQTALSAVLGFDGGVPPDPAVVAAAIPELSRSAGEAVPLLIVVDDLQWADAASLAVLRLLAAEVADRRIGVLTASRRAAAEALVGDRLEIGPLDDAASAALVDRGPEPVSPDRRRILVAARGNPLILTELRRSGWNGSEVPPGGLRDSYAAELATVPDEARAGMLLAALTTGEIIDFPGASKVLEPVRSRYIVVTGADGSLRFRDPLLRRMVVSTATAEEQAHAQRELARMFEDDPRRRAWHLSEVTFQPDDKVAELLEEGARQSLSEGRATAAINALLRAAELSTDPADRGRRLAGAASVGVAVSGDLDEADSLLEAVRTAMPKGRASLPATIATAQVLIDGSGDVDTAHRLLNAAVEAPAERPGADRQLLTEALFELVNVCRYGGRDELWPPLEAVLARMRPGPPPMLLLYAHSQRGPAHVTRDDLQVLDELVRGLETETDPVRINRIVTSALVLDRGPSCRPTLWRVIEDGRSGDAVRLAIAALFAVGMDDYALGEWQEAGASGDELVRLAQSHGYSYLARLGRVIPLLVAAGRGDEDAVSRSSREIAAWAAPRRLASLVEWCHQVRASAALAQGQFEDAYQHCAAIAAPGELPRSAFAVRSGYDMVESALRTNRAAEAAAHAGALATGGLDHISDRYELMVAGTAAMVADDVAAPALFHAALALPGAGRYRFEAARLHLLCGERLRRTRKMIAAREHLTVALREFRDMQATPWVDRTSRELEATSRNRRRAAAAEPSRLTPQEREVAELAATGFTNKQIGERLQLSPRTVATHLEQAYHKLGITSRGALRDALGD